MSHLTPQRVVALALRHENETWAALMQMKRQNTRSYNFKPLLLMPNLNFETTKR